MRRYGEVIKFMGGNYDASVLFNENQGLSEQQIKSIQTKGLSDATVDKTKYNTAADKVITEDSYKDYYTSLAKARAGQKNSFDTDNNPNNLKNDTVRKETGSLSGIKVEYNRDSSLGTIGQLMFPTQNVGINSKFGMRFHPKLHKTLMHKGVDIPVAYQPVYASEAGIVTFVGVKSGYGNFIVINHGEGIETKYAHLDKFAVSAGQQVSKGQIIGTSGATGRVTGPHLHYEVWKKGSPIDPETVLDGSGLIKGGAIAKKIPVYDEADETNINPVKTADIFGSNYQNTVDKLKKVSDIINKETIGAPQDILKVPDKRIDYEELGLERARQATLAKKKEEAKYVKPVLDHPIAPSEYINSYSSSAAAMTKELYEANRLAREQAALLSKQLETTQKFQNTKLEADAQRDKVKAAEIEAKKAENQKKQLTQLNEAKKQLKETKTIVKKAMPKASTKTQKQTTVKESFLYGKAQ